MKPEVYINQTSVHLGNIIQLLSHLHTLFPHWLSPLSLTFVTLIYTNIYFTHLITTPYLHYH